MADEIKYFTVQEATDLFGITGIEFGKDRTIKNLTLSGYFEIFKFCQLWMPTIIGKYNDSKILTYRGKEPIFIDSSGEEYTLMPRMLVNGNVDGNVLKYNTTKNTNTTYTQPEGISFLTFFADPKMAGKTFRVKFYYTNRNDPIEHVGILPYEIKIDNSVIRRSNILNWYQLFYRKMSTKAYGFSTDIQFNKEAAIVSISNLASLYKTEVYFRNIMTLINEYLDIVGTKITHSVYAVDPNNKDDKFLMAKNFAITDTVNINKLNVDDVKNRFVMYCVTLSGGNSNLLYYGSEYLMHGVGVKSGENLNYPCYIIDKQDLIQASINDSDNKIEELLGEGLKTEDGIPILPIYSGFEYNILTKDKEHIFYNTDGSELTLAQKLSTTLEVVYTGIYNIDDISGSYNNSILKFRFVSGTNNILYIDGLVSGKSLLKEFEDKYKELGYTLDKPIPIVRRYRQQFNRVFGEWKTDVIDAYISFVKYKGGITEFDYEKSPLVKGQIEYCKPIKCGDEYVELKRKPLVGDERYLGFNFTTSKIDFYGNLKSIPNAITGNPNQVSKLPIMYDDYYLGTSINANVTNYQVLDTSKNILYDRGKVSLYPIIYFNDTKSTIGLIKDRMIHEDDSVTIVNNVYNPPYSFKHIVYDWFKDGVKIKTDIPNNNLYFSNVSKSDSGIYKCISKYVNNMDLNSDESNLILESNEFELVVEDKVNITLKIDGETNIELIEGDSLSISATMISDKDVNIKNAVCYFNGNPIRTYNDLVNIKKSQYVYTFTNLLKESDSGIYHFELDFDYGSHTHRITSESILLNISQKSNINASVTINDNVNNVVLNEGTGYTIKPKFEIDDISKYDVKYKWIKKTENDKIVSTEPTIYIDDIQYENSGQFYLECLLSRSGYNSLSIKSNIVSVKVLVDPKIELYISCSSDEIIVGDTVELRYSHISSPYNGIDLNYSWYKNDILIEGSENKNSITDTVDVVGDDIYYVKGKATQKFPDKFPEFIDNIVQSNILTITGIDKLDPELFNIEIDAPKSPYNINSTVIFNYKSNVQNHNDRNKYEIVWYKDNAIFYIGDYFSINNTRVEDTGIYSVALINKSNGDYIISKPFDVVVDYIPYDNDCEYHHIFDYSYRNSCGIIIGWWVKDEMVESLLLGKPWFVYPDDYKYSCIYKSIVSAIVKYSNIEIMETRHGYIGKLNNNEIGL